MFAVPLVLFTAVFSAQNRCSVDVWWVRVGGQMVQVQGSFFREAQLVSAL